MSSKVLPPCWGFPLPTGQSTSYWLQQVKGDSLLHHGSQEQLPEWVDTVIIGSGITGCLVAKFLKESCPSKTIVILEAREFCSGATGRNAGNCKSGSWRVFAKYEKAFGADQAIKILQNEEEAQRALVAYVQENDIDCDLWSGKSFDVPVTYTAAREAHNAYLRYRDAGGTVEHIDVDLEPLSAARTTRLSTAQACYARPAATLQPWKLAAHVMRENLAHGVLLRTFTVARNVEPSTQSGSKWKVRTDRGDVFCNRVVHATNGYTGAQEPIFRELLRPHPHICIQARPPLSFLGGCDRRNSYTILLSDGATVSINPRFLLDEMVLLGGDNPGQRTFDEWINANPEHCVDDGFTEGKMVTQEMLRLSAVDYNDRTSELPSRGEIIHESSWSGILGMTPDRVPFIGEIPGKEEQWVCVGLNGYGMTKVFTAAPGLAKLMNGGSWESTGLPEAYRLSMSRVERLHSGVCVHS